ncbi:MAG: Verru_Chthon cassette protein D [Verrucomicrobiota bacterium]
MKTVRPLPRRLFRAAFTLIELCVCVSTVLLLVALTTPTLLDVLDANRMTQAADIVQGRLTEARGLAVTFASDVEVRIFRNSPIPAVDGGSGQGIQVLRLREVDAGTSADPDEPLSIEFVPEGDEDPLPSSIGISTNDEFSSLWTLPPHTLVTDQGDRPYVAFRFRPDGSTDLSEAVSWTLTLVRQPTPDPAVLTKNFVALQLDPVTGHISSFRPE